MATIDTSSTSFMGVIPERGRIPVWVSSLFDIAGVAVAVFVAFAVLTVGYSLIGENYETAGRLFMERAGSLAFVLIVLPIWFLFKGHYHRRIPFWSEAREVVQACVLALLLEGFLLYSGKADVSRLMTFVTWSCAPFLVMGLRFLLKFAARSSGVGISRVLIVGHSEALSHATSFIRADRHLGYTIASSMSPASAHEVSDKMAAVGADVVLIALSGSDENESLLAADLRLSGVPIMVMPPKMGLPSGIGVQYVLGEESLLFVDRVDAVPALTAAAKRVFDIVLSITALSVFAIPMLIVAGAVKLDGGPAVFGHFRVGKDGRMFKCLKFRSMKVDAQEQLQALLERDQHARSEWEATRKLKNDPRVTRLGRFIRKSGLDELPQLLNVIRGDMSLVGPRPVTESEMSQYGSEADRYKRVRPGITGLWQVSGRNDTTYEQRVSLDAWYVANWSPWHDFVIILKTVPAVLLRRGAY